MWLLGSCAAPVGPPATAPGAPGVDRALIGGDLPPPAPREFRAVWVATVANIDWPSKRGLSTAEQKAEAIEILETSRKLGLNAVIFQVRPAADALYESALEPWSEYLTGEQGQAPMPAYDPLRFWIDEAHLRGLELHAWFNPYRARHTSAKAKNAATHIANTHPGVVKSYGTFLWMDPGEPLAERRTLDVVLDVVRRYDVDGVHIDDYFYPYPVNVHGSMPPVEIDFPDEPSWKRWLDQGGAPDKAAWRRGNVDRLVEAIYRNVKMAKPWVRFGVSPFGIGKPDKRPPGIQGFSQYDKLYADVEKWLANGWMDYLAPQLYWPIAQKEQSFEVLLDYWHRENTAGRHVFPGYFTSRIDATDRSWSPREIVEQIALTRSRHFPQGHIHFSAVALKENRRGINDVLKFSDYQGMAVPPAAPWLGTSTVKPPLISFAGRGANGEPPMVNVTSLPPTPWRVGIWARRAGVWRFIAAAGAMEEPGAKALMFGMGVNGGPGEGDLEIVVASAFDRLGNESERVVLDLTKGIPR